MQLLLFAVAIIWLGTETSADNAQDVMGKVKAGMEATNAIVTALGDENLSETFGKIGTVAAKIGPFLSAVGPAVALVSVFLPASPSPELEKMQLEFAEVDANFDKVFKNSEDVKKLIQKAGLNAIYAAYKHTITSLSTRLNDFLNATTAHVGVFNRSFIESYDSSNKDATLNIWNGMMEDNPVLSNNIPLTAMNYLDNDRKKVQKFMKEVLNLILQGVKVKLAYLKAKGLNHDYIVKQGYWKTKVTQLVNKMKSYDNIVKGRWYNQIQQDIPAKLAEWRGQSHSTFATNLYNFLNSKYDWRDWHVVAYNELHGGNHHWVKWCSGYHSFRHHGRNLVVASVDHNKPLTNKNDAYNKLGRVSTNKWCEVVISWWGSKKVKCTKRSAKDVYENYLPREFKSGCNFASAGVIDKNAGIAHRAPSNRLAVRDNNDYKLYAFG